MFGSGFPRSLVVSFLLLHLSFEPSDHNRPRAATMPMMVGMMMCAVMRFVEAHKSQARNLERVVLYTRLSSQMSIRCHFITFRSNFNDCLSSPMRGVRHRTLRQSAISGSERAASLDLMMLGLGELADTLTWKCLLAISHHHESSQKERMPKGFFAHKIQRCLPQGLGLRHSAWVLEMSMEVNHQFCGAG